MFQSSKHLFCTSLLVGLVSNNMLARNVRAAATAEPQWDVLTIFARHIPVMSKSLHHVIDSS